jgi:hypothetical protein
MAVLSVPLRGAEVERVPLGFLFQGADQLRADSRAAIAMGMRGEDNC